MASVMRRLSPLIQNSGTSAHELWTISWEAMLRPLFSCAIATEVAWGPGCMSSVVLMLSATRLNPMSKSKNVKKNLGISMGESVELSTRL